MGTPATGQVILLPFPFSDLSASKVRPAVCLANAGRGDWVLCQVTSRSYADPVAVVLADADFVQGGLRTTSYARPAKLFTAHESLFAGTAGQLSPALTSDVLNAVIRLMESSRPTPS